MKGKQKLILFSLIAVAIVLLAVGLTTAFLYNYNSYSPKEVQIVDDEKEISFYIEMNDSYSSYEFNFKSKNAREIVIETKSNVLYASEAYEKGIKIGKKYQIKARYISENSGNNSEYSKPIEWTSYKILSAPEIEYDVENNIIQWQEVENADYYEVYYNKKEGYETYRTNSTKFDLHFIEGGQKEFYIIAKSEDENYKQSAKSNVIRMTLVHHYVPVAVSDYDPENKIVTFTSPEKLTKVNVYVGESVYEKVVEGVYDSESEIYTYTIEIKTIFRQGREIGIAPTSIDEYNIYDGEIEIIFSEGE